MCRLYAQESRWCSSNLNWTRGTDGVNPRSSLKGQECSTEFRAEEARCPMYVSHSVVSDSCDPMDCSPPGSSVHGILQARVLEWVAISFSRESSWPRDQTQFPHIAGGCFTLWATREALAASKLALPPPLVSNQASTDLMMPTCTGVSHHYSGYGFKCSPLHGTNGKEPACQHRRHKIYRFNPWVRNIPWRRAWQPIPVLWKIPWTEKTGGPCP